ncbi:MAG TPA: protein translocase subunit SecD [Caldilineaceae bacterium]|nr:protein translocase subunit SecD [Caldilineaceae bacterium]
MRNTTVALVLILLLSAAALYIVLPIDHPAWLERTLSGQGTRDLRNFKLGLDLQGGTQVLLEADLPEGQTPDSGAMEAARTIVENRVNGLGVAEAMVQAQGDDRLIVELPGVENPDQAVETLRSTGQLEFVDPGGVPLEQGMVINTTNHPTAASDLQAQIAEGNPVIGQPAYPDQVFQTVMTGEILRNAVATQDQFNQWQINFELTAAGSDQFYEYTRTHIGQPLAIVLDGRVLSAPTINAAIQDNGVITGLFTDEEAESLAVQMRYGALPVPLRVADIRTIGASLGQDSVESSLRAGILGVAAVLLYMLLMYRLPGVLSAVALIIYVLLNLMLFKLIPVTLTLPGIAGFILSVGMAVDANILIFERMKEELRNGRSVRLAVETGFDRAWLAIRDGNFSTLISCAVLYWFGNTFGASVVKGFALTLSIGVVLSMLTAVAITRTFMRAFLSSSGRKLLESRTLLNY